MKKALYILSALSLMLLPVGFAFAENMIPPPPSGENGSLGDQQNGPGPQMMGGGDQQEGQQGGDRWNIPVHIQQGGPMMGDSRDNQDKPDISSSSEGEQQWASSTPRGAEGMPWFNGMKRGIMRHFGTTTPLGFFEHHGSSSDESASGTIDRPRFPGVPQFWKWLFGGRNSSTTATSSQQLSPQDQNQGENTDSGSSTQQAQPNPVFWGGFFERLKSLF